MRAAFVLILAAATDTDPADDIACRGLYGQAACKRHKARDKGRTRQSGVHAIALHTKRQVGKGPGRCSIQRRRDRLVLRNVLQALQAPSCRAAAISRPPSSTTTTFTFAYPAAACAAKQAAIIASAAL
nr:hypothetical protein [Bradyrhizobium sp. 33ap4]